MQNGYQAAVTLAETALASLDTKNVCARKNANWDGFGYHIPWFGEYIPVKSGSPVEQVLWLHYLTSEGGRTPTGKLVAFRELRGAGFYEPKFIARAVNPIVKRFGGNPQELYAAGAALGGSPAGVGDVSVTLLPLPNLPVTYIVQAGDDEFPADGSILFDEAASDWLPAEDLVILASLGAYKLVRF